MNVTSLELSKRLQDIGFSAMHSFFMWVYVEGKDWICVHNEKMIQDAKEKFPAYTAEDILENLPVSIIINGEPRNLVIHDDRDWEGEASWDIVYATNQGDWSPIHVRTKSDIGSGAFACGLARMYLLLKDRNLI